MPSTRFKALVVTAAILSHLIAPSRFIPAFDCTSRFIPAFNRTPMKFYKTLISIAMSSPPTNIQSAAIRTLSTYLLKYSSKLNGILLSYTLLGTTEEYTMVYDSAEVVGTFLVECVVMEVCGDVVEVVDGYAVGVFYVGDCTHFHVKGVVQGKGNAELVGDKLN